MPAEMTHKLPTIRVFRLMRKAAGVNSSAQRGSWPGTKPRREGTTKPPLSKLRPVRNRSWRSRE